MKLIKYLATLLLIILNLERGRTEGALRDKLHFVFNLPVAAGSVVGFNLPESFNYWRHGGSLIKPSETVAGVSRELDAELRCNEGLRYKYVRSAKIYSLQQLLNESIQSLAVEQLQNCCKL